MKLNVKVFLLCVPSDKYVNIYLIMPLVFQRLDRLEIKQLEADENFKQISKQLEAPKEHKAVIFYQGQMYDATSLIEDIVAKAKSEIILIDNYIDKNTLDLLAKNVKQ